jgi:hypothetical protein
MVALVLLCVTITRVHLTQSSRPIGCYLFFRIGDIRGISKIPLCVHGDRREISCQAQIAPICSGVDPVPVWHCLLLKVHLAIRPNFVLASLGRFETIPNWFVLGVRH